MTILEALRETTESIKKWVEGRFLNKNNIDISLNSTSTNPVQNKVINTEINNIKTLIGDIDVSEQIDSAMSALTADDVGIYVQDTEPINAVPGDIWIDTANDPTFIEVNIPDTLPNPNALTFSGAVNTSYDGSNAVSVEIPNVSSWAKASTKPAYTKTEVGLGNVDNVKQYSASNPPPYPVTSVNGKTGAVSINELPTVTTADNGKVLMVVNGAYKLVSLNLSIDADGVVYM